MISKTVTASRIKKPSRTELVDSASLWISTNERRSNYVDMIPTTIAFNIDAGACWLVSTLETLSISEALTQFPHTNTPVAA